MRSKRSRPKKTQVDPYHTVKVVYVDPDAGERPWGYRVLIGGTDVTRDVAKRAHLKSYSFFRTMRTETIEGKPVTVQRWEWDWIAGRELDNLIDALQLFGHASMPSDIWVVHPEPTSEAESATGKAPKVDRRRLKKSGGVCV